MSNVEDKLSAASPEDANRTKKRFEENGGMLWAGTVMWGEDEIFLMIREFLGETEEEAVANLALHLDEFLESAPMFSMLAPMDDLEASGNAVPLYDTGIYEGDPPEDHLFDMYAGQLGGVNLALVGGPRYDEKQAAEAEEDGKE